MTTPRKTSAQKRILNTSHKRHEKAAAKVAVLPRSVISAEMAEAEDLSLVNSPYQIFAPLLELVTTPFRMLFPFTPWPIMPMQRPRGKYPPRHLANS